MFSKFFYKRKLKQCLSTRSIKRCFLNAQNVRHIVVGIECQDFDLLKTVQKEVKQAFQGKVKVTILAFINIKSLEDNMGLDGADLVLFCKENLTNKIIPKDETVERVDALSPDVFINLNKDVSPVIDFFNQVSNAKMCVGFEEKEEYVDLMLPVSIEDGYIPFFKGMMQVMGHINAS